MALKYFHETMGQLTSTFAKVWTDNKWFSSRSVELPSMQRAGVKI